MTPRDDFKLAIARFFHERLSSEGLIFIDQTEMEHLIAAQEVPDRLGGLIVDELVAQGLIEFDRGIFKGGAQLVLDYEQEHDRDAFYAANVARRELLEAAAGVAEVEFRKDAPESYTARRGTKRGRQPGSSKPSDWGGFASTWEAASTSR